MQHVGRHSSYATQFWTRTSRPSSRTRDAALLAHSRKSIRRRLVLPLETHNWARALEVLHSRYARRGRSAKDFQCVVRGIAADADAAAQTAERRGIAAETLDALRDAAFAGEVPSNAALWTSLVWANARLRRADAGLRCLFLADRRCKLSAPTRRHMADLLLPLLAAQGMAEEAAHVAERFAGLHHNNSDDNNKNNDNNDNNDNSSSSSSNINNNKSPPRSAKERQRVAGLVAEAAARAGDWAHALASLRQSSEREEMPRTIEGLFAQREGQSAVNSSLTGASSSASASSVNADVPPLCEGLTTDALRAMMCAMADDGQCDAALRCLSELRRRSHSHSDSHSDSYSDSHSDSYSDSHSDSYSNTYSDSRSNSPVALTESELQRLLNGFGAAGRCDEAVELFRAQCLTPGAAPMSATTLNLIFSAFPRTTHKVELPGSAAAIDIDAMHDPRAVVDLFDTVLRLRDDATLTDWVLAAVAPALVQLNESERALCLMRHSEALCGRSAKHSNDTNRLLRTRLLALLFAIYANGSPVVRKYALLHFPTAFPSEAYRDMPPPEELKKRLAQRAPARRRDDFDTALREQLEKVRARSSEAFPAGADPERDPRPVPKGLHDTASGWNFYGRGGEMVFGNHRRTANPLSMHPKVMRTLANPYRGWSPWQNSALAHRERVRKWNGKSAV